MQSFGHLSTPESTCHHHMELTSVGHLKPGSPQLPAHPPDSPLPPGIRLPSSSAAAAAAGMMLNQQSLLRDEDMCSLVFQ